MNLRVVFQLIRVIKYAATIVAPYNGELSILAEVGSRYKLCLAIYLIPQCHLFVGYVPQPWLPSRLPLKK